MRSSNLEIKAATGLADLEPVPETGLAGRDLLLSRPEGLAGLDLLLSRPEGLAGLELLLILEDSTGVDGLEPF